MANDPVTGRKRFEAVLNTKNPLGSGGAIARAFSKLLEEMWLGGRTVVPPRQLKVPLGRGEGCEWRGEERCFGGGERCGEGMFWGGGGV